MTDNKEEIDLTSPVKEIVNDTSAIDSKSQAQLRITELELELRQCRLDIEKESLDRIKKNSAGRTCIVWAAARAAPGRTGWKFAHPAAVRLRRE